MKIAVVLLALWCGWLTWCVYLLVRYTERLGRYIDILNDTFGRD